MFFVYAKNKGTDLCVRYIDSIIPLLPLSEISICRCTVRFVSDLVGNPQDRFSYDSVHLIHCRLFQDTPHFIVS